MPSAFQNYLGFSRPSELPLVSASDQQQEAMPTPPSGLMVWRGEGTAGNKAEAQVSFQVRVRGEPPCDSVKDDGSVYLFGIYRNYY